MAIDYDNPIPAPDGYHANPTIRGMRAVDVVDMLDREERLAALFAKP